jgi:hypothetical protein
MVSRALLRALRRQATGVRVLVHCTDGSTRSFNRMHVQAQVYLWRLAATAGGELPPGDVLSAYRLATPESKRMLDRMAARADNGIGDLEPLDAEVAKEEVVDLSEGESLSP